MQSKTNQGIIKLTFFEFIVFVLQGKILLGDGGAFQKGILNIRRRLLTDQGGLFFCVQISNEQEGEKDGTGQERIFLVI